MVDAFTSHAASALAATSVVRSIVGGTLPIAGLPLYETLGYGWVSSEFPFNTITTNYGQGNSLLSLIALLVSVGPLLFWKYGETLRKRYTMSSE